MFIGGAWRGGSGGRNVSLYVRKGRVTAISIDAVL
jgi:hypothetical protein